MAGGRRTIPATAWVVGAVGGALAFLFWWAFVEIATLPRVLIALGAATVTASVAVAGVEKNRRGSTVGRVVLGAALLFAELVLNVLVFLFTAFRPE